MKRAFDRGPYTLNLQIEKKVWGLVIPKGQDSCKEKLFSFGDLYIATIRWSIDSKSLLGFQKFVDYIQLSFQ